MNELELLRGASRALAEVSTAAQAWQLARDAEAARHYAQMRRLGRESINYAILIKAKAMMLLADFVDEGQRLGTISSQGSHVSDENMSLRQLLEANSDEQARQAVFQARKLRESLRGVDLDELIAEANDEDEDLGLSGLRLRAAKKRHPEPVQEQPPLPPGEYRCIVIDPPWPMPKIQRGERPDQGAELDYAVLSLDDIAALDVKRLAATDSHLYLWVTHKFLPAGLQFAEHWGFNYQCLMTWRKNVGITPFSWMYDTEHVIFARRGNLPLTKLGLRLSFDAPVAGHSIKPDVFYDRVRAASPGPRLDMFPGVAHEGFQPWGLEASHR